MMKFQAAADCKAQRVKLQDDFLKFYNLQFHGYRSDKNYQNPAKTCFHKKGLELLDISAENRYLTYSVSQKVLCCIT